MDIKQEIKTLFDDTELSEDTLNKMEILLSESIKNKTDPLADEVVALKIQIAEMTEQHKLELEEMEQKANEYGTFLQEKADEYGTFLQEKADEYGTFLQEKANDYGKYVVEELSDKIEDYTTYVVEKFVDENKSALLEQAEYDRMKKLFEDVKTSFELNSFKLNEVAPTPSKENDHSDELAENVKAYNALYGEFVEVKKQLENAQYSMVFESITDDLTDTQKERINKLIKNVSFSSIDEFKRGVELMVEEITSFKSTPQLNEIEYQQDILDNIPAKKSVDDKMQKYLNHL